MLASWSSPFDSYLLLVYYVYTSYKLDILSKPHCFLIHIES